jgi:hypothetical protein
VFGERYDINPGRTFFSKKSKRKGKTSHCNAFLLASAQSQGSIGHVLALQPECLVRPPSNPDDRSEKPLLYWVAALLGEYKFMA